MMFNFNAVVKWAGVLAVWTLIVFAPSLNNDLLEYDDAIYIKQNPTVWNLSLDNIKGILADEDYGGGIFPLPFLSYAIEYHFFKDAPWIYHLNNVILHVLNVLLVYTLIYLISSRVHLALLTALLFSIHPLRVESVAWVAERKDVLYAFFYLGSLIMYVVAIRGKVLLKRYLAAACLLFLAALFSKPQAITLPLVIGAIDLFYKRRPLIKVCCEKWPFILITAAYYFFWMQPHTHLLTLTDPRIAGSAEKILLSCYAFLIYVFKGLIPYQLSCMYPFPHKIDGYFPGLVYVAPVVVLMLGYCVYRYFRKDRLVILGCVFFVINMVMPLRLIWYNWFVGEHYTYLPSIGLSLAFASIILAVLEHKGQRLVRLGYFFLVAYIISLSGMTYQYCKVWGDDITLWSQAIKVNPQGLRTAFAFWYRGVAYEKRGAHLLALADFEQAIRIYPDFKEAQRSRALALSRMGMR